MAALSSHSSDCRIVGYFKLGYEESGGLTMIPDRYMMNGRRTFHERKNVRTCSIGEDLLRYHLPHGWRILLSQIPCDILVLYETAFKDRGKNW